MGTTPRLNPLSVGVFAEGSLPDETEIAVTGDNFTDCLCTLPRMAGVWLCWAQGLRINYNSVKVSKLGLANQVGGALPADSFPQGISFAAVIIRLLHTGSFHQLAGGRGRPMRIETQEGPSGIVPSARMMYRSHLGIAFQHTQNGVERNHTLL